MQRAVEPLVRFGVAVPQKLLDSFDSRLADAGMPNRSEALRQLIREYVAQDTWEKGGAAGRVKVFLTALRAVKAVQSVSPVIAALV